MYCLEGSGKEKSPQCSAPRSAKWYIGDAVTRRGYNRTSSWRGDGAFWSDGSDRVSSTTDITPRRPSSFTTDHASDAGYKRLCDLRCRTMSLCVRDAGTKVNTARLASARHRPYL